MGRNCRDWHIAVVPSNLYRSHCRYNVTSSKCITGRFAHETRLTIILTMIVVAFIWSGNACKQKIPRSILWWHMSGFSSFCSKIFFCVAQVTRIRRRPRLTLRSDYLFLTVHLWMWSNRWNLGHRAKASGRNYGYNGPNIRTSRCWTVFYKCCSSLSSVKC